MKISLAQSGSLGEQLFQYASALFFAHQFGADLEVLEEPASSLQAHGFPIVLSKFTISAPIRSFTAWDRLVTSREPRQQALAAAARTATLNHVLYEKDLRAYTFPRELEVSSLTRRLYLFGSVHSHHLPDALGPILRREFALTDAPTGRNLALFDRIRACSSAVSVHITRADRAPHTAPGGKLTAPLAYHRNAIETICRRIPNPTFFVFADDVEACRNHLPASLNLVFVDHNDSLHAYEDLRLISACRHHIVSANAFSWWGAWLNPDAAKIVCAPAMWRGEANSADLIPPQWTRCATGSVPAEIPARPLEPRRIPALAHHSSPARRVAAVSA